MDALVPHLTQARSTLVEQQLKASRNGSILAGLVVVLVLILVITSVSWLSISIRSLDALQKARELEAMHDPLTMLPNRRYLTEWTSMALDAARQTTVAGCRLLRSRWVQSGERSVRARRRRPGFARYGRSATPLRAVVRFCRSHGRGRVCHGAVRCPAASQLVRADRAVAV